MSRFIISHRRAGKRAHWEHRRAQSVLSEALHGAGRVNADLVGENSPGHDQARHVAVMEADDEEVRAKVRDPDLIAEPRMDHFAGRVRAPDVGEADPEELAADAGSGEVLDVRVTDGEGHPLPGIHVFAYFGEKPDWKQLAATTDERGRARFDYHGSLPLTHVAAVPRHSRWSMIHTGEARELTIRCDGLPAADRGTGWWHRDAGYTRYAGTRGRGLRVGVIDTGVGPNDNLGHVKDLGAVVDAALDEAGGGDVRGHGSHVCGIIGARVRDMAQYGGIAPGCRLHSMRVFGPAGGAHQGDIALAIWAMAHEHHCHLINLSLGTEKRSEIEHDAVLDAIEQGSLCIAAVGNTAGAIEYPAAFDEVVGVTALGRRDWGPEGSLAAFRVPEQRDRFGRGEFYLANFSCFGAAVNASGAGVGIISTVRGDDETPAPYAAYGGTSMATPYVTGVLAAALSRDRAYRKMPRDETRVDAARRKLRKLCTDMGLAREYQGDGLVVNG